MEHGNAQVVRIALRVRHGRQMEPVVQHVDGAVEAFLHLNAAACVADALVVAWDVDDQLAEANSVVIGHDTPVLETEDLVVMPAFGPGQPRRRGVGRGHAESVVMPREIPLQHHIRLFAIDRASQSQLAREAILEGTPETFHTAFGLRRARPDQPNAELAKESTKLRWLRMITELLFQAQRRLLGDEEDRVAIAVQGQRDATTAHHLTEQLEVPVRVFLLAKTGPGHDAGGVIDAAQQREIRTSPFQPVVAAAVDLQQHAFLGHALSTSAMTRSTPLPCRCNAGSGQDAVHTRAREVDVLLGGEHLREMFPIEARVRTRGQLDHPSGQGTIDFPGVTILDYAGGGLWNREEDFWAVPTAYRTVEEYAEACKLHDPEHREKRTRLHWGNGPEWTQGGRSYAERPRSR